MIVPELSHPFSEKVQFSHLFSEKVQFSHPFSEEVRAALRSQAQAIVNVSILLLIQR